MSNSPLAFEPLLGSPNSRPSLHCPYRRLVSSPLTHNLEMNVRACAPVVTAWSQPASHQQRCTNPHCTGRVSKRFSDVKMTDATSSLFRTLPDGSIEVDEGAGNVFHLGPILRKYTSARLAVKVGRRGVTTVEPSLLYDALGLLRSLRYDVAQFNAAASGSLSPSELRYACFRLARQASAFGVRIPRAGTGTVEVPGLDELIAHIERGNREKIDAANGMIAGGIVDFDSLAQLYLPGTDFVDRGAATGYFGIPTAMRVRACYFSRGKSLFGVVSTFFVALEVVVAVGDRFAVIETHFPITEFAGTRSTNGGMESFVVLSPEMQAELVRRGEQYARLTTASAFVEYTPGSFMPVHKGGLGRTAARARGGGRVMIDSHAAWVRGVHCARAEGVASEAVKAVLKLVAQRARTTAVVTAVSGQSADGYTAGSGGQQASTQEEESLELLLLSGPLPMNLRWLTWPVVAGFAFHVKSWGVVMVSGLRDVVFNEAAFARLVIPPGRKRLIEALVLSHRGHVDGNRVVRTSVTASDSRVTEGRLGNEPLQVADPLKVPLGTQAAHADLIAGKGEGTIFLLYGPPGVGKTLTAEAIAELLHKPLYVVSMGELGTTPEALEERLQDVLDLCVPWGALVLIDEAEMLLERRTKSDIVRNAMVCVMLKLLEYYSGILFLTTNRVESLDPAFQSRVQCALRYSALDESSRRHVWSNLIENSGVELGPDVNVAALAVHTLNGRQIKNVLQLAMSLSRYEQVPLSQRHFDATLEVTTAFVSEIESSLN